MSTRFMTAALAAAAIVAVPVQGAAAKQGGEHGSHGPAAEHGHGHANGKCRKAHSTAFAAAGTLAGYTADSVTLDVTRANKHARDYIAAAGSTFSLAGARLRFEGVTDADGSGTVDFADVLPTDVMRVNGKVSKPKRGCPAADSTVTVRKVHVERPGAGDEAEQEDDES